MSSNTDLIIEVQQRSKKFLDWIELTIEDPNAIKAAIQFFEYNESALKAIIKLAQIDLSASSLIEAENSSITRVLSKYSVDRCFNEKEASDKLISGLTRVVKEGYTFNGMFYEKGLQKLWA